MINIIGNFIGSNSNKGGQSPWILATGVWRDEGLWLDDSTWLD
jgi:hypothetical protein